MIALLRLWPVLLPAAVVLAVIVHYEGVPLIYQGKIDRVCAERMASAISRERTRQAEIADTYSRQYDEIARRLEAERSERLRIMEELDEAARRDPDAARVCLGSDSLRRLQSGD